MSYGDKEGAIGYLIGEENKGVGYMFTMMNHARVNVGLEGVALFILLWWYSARARPRGAISGLFLIGYGSCRFITEFFREPDAGIFGHSYSISMGQWLSLPMLLAGVALLALAYRKKSL